jgi:hypothetical protein
MVSMVLTVLTVSMDSAKDDRRGWYGSWYDRGCCCGCCCRRRRLPIDAQLFRLCLLPLLARL